MSWRATPLKRATVVEGSPAEAAPGDELLWISDDPAGPTHHAVEVGLVLHDPDRGHVRVLSRDGAELEFDVDCVVVLVRGVQGLLARGRASDDPHAQTVALR